jgi:hypothetical protein
MDFRGWFLTQPVLHPVSMFPTHLIKIKQSGFLPSYAGYETGLPDWANFHPMGDYLLWLILENYRGETHF